MNNIENTSENSKDLDEALVRDKAYGLLSRREYSARELTQKLAKWASAGLIEQIIGELQKAGAQSDERFAEMLCRSRYNNGKGPVRIRLELSNHGIDDDLIQAAMAPYSGEWRALAEQVRARKFGAEPPASYSEWAKQARFLQQRGFGTEHVAGYDQ